MSKKEQPFTDLVKKAFFTGIGAIFMTEETVRQTLGEMKVPQELMKNVLQNAKKGKEEVLEVFRNEFHKVLQRYDLAQELGKFLREHDVDIHVRFTRKETPPSE